MMDVRLSVEMQQNLQKNTGVVWTLYRWKMKQSDQQGKTRWTKGNDNDGLLGRRLFTRGFYGGRSKRGNGKRKTGKHENIMCMGTET